MMVREGSGAHPTTDLSGSRATDASGKVDALIKASWFFFFPPSLAVNAESGQRSATDWGPRLADSSCVVQGLGRVDSNMNHDLTRNGGSPSFFSVSTGVCCSKGSFSLGLGHAEKIRGRRGRKC